MQDTFVKQCVAALTDSTSKEAPGGSTDLAQSTSQALRAIVAEAAAANTTRSYATALRYWAAWYALRFGRAIALPLEESDVLTFLADHVGRGATADGALAFELPAVVDDALVRDGVKASRGPLKISTIGHRIAALSTAHTLRNVPNPCTGAQVRFILGRARRAAAKRGDGPRKKDALCKAELHAMLETCDGSLAGLRDRALLTFTFASGGRRRSEVAAAQVRDLKRTPDGNWVYRLTSGKTLQAGRTPGHASEKPVKGIAARALDAWLHASGVRDGALFRRVRGLSVGAALSGKAVAEIVQRRAAAAGLQGDFAGHSLRSGFSTESGRQNVPLQEAMQLTDHASVQAFLGYYRAGSVESNGAGALLDDRADAPLNPAARSLDP